MHDPERQEQAFKIVEGAPSDMTDQLRELVARKGHLTEGGDTAGTAELSAYPSRSNVAPGRPIAVAAVSSNVPPTTVSMADVAIAPIGKIIFVSTIMALMFSYLIGLGQGAAAPGVARQMMVDLPGQCAWLYCMYKLNGSIGIAYGKKPPVPYWLLCILAAVSFISVPIFDQFHMVFRGVDPWFGIWVLSQTIFPVRCAWFIARNEEPDRKFPWQFPVRLGVAVNLYLLFGIINPAITSSMLNFSIAWYCCQFLGIGFLASVIGKRTKAILDARNRSVYPLRSGPDTVVRYREYAGLERWIKQRFSSSSKPSSKSMLHHLDVYFSPIIVAGIMICALPYIESVTGKSVTDVATNKVPIQAQKSAPQSALALTIDEIVNQKKQAAAAPEQAHTAAGEASRSVMLNILGVLATVSLLGIVIYRRRPGHLALSSEGIRLQWRRGTWTREGNVTRWRDLESINLIRTKGVLGDTGEAIAFRANGQNSFVLPLSSIETANEREAILKAIQEYAPLVERDPKVIECLQPRADHSYTELWLQALTAPPKRERLQPLIPGARLQDGKYVVRNSIGVGGQGQAYLCTNSQGEAVVLKEFLLPVYVDVDVRKNALEQFQNEARILRTLAHDRIVRLDDYFIEDHRAYLVLEHIDGASLRTIVKKKGKLSEESVRELALQMCDMLEYLHGLSPPVVHRDFTPDNLILGKDGKLKLIDFNVAKQLEESTAVGTVVGKHAYLPPEQFRGEPEPASDIYAMGGTLHYLLTGGDPEPVSMSSPILVEGTEVSEQMNSVVQHATALSLTKRYARISELKRDLN